MYGLKNLDCFNPHDSVHVFPVELTIPSRYKIKSYMHKSLQKFRDTVKHNLRQMLSSMHPACVGKILILIYRGSTLLLSRQRMVTTPPKYRQAIVGRL